MTDNDIIKALKSEIKRANYIESYYIDCVDVGVFQNALDLINRQKAEIERLKKRIGEQKHALFEQAYTAELQNKIITAKSEVIKEFAERLKNRNTTMDKRIISVESVDNLVKEMTEMLED